MAGKSRWAVVLDAALESGISRRVAELLGSSLACTLLYDAGEPTIARLDGLAARARAAGADAVVGVGGGSTMDSAKGIAVLLTNPGGGAQYQGFGLVRNTPAPLLLVPTTAGSGSEATYSAVFINEATGIKRGINGPGVRAFAAVLDAELTDDLPPAQRAASGMDALIHAIESYAALNATRYSRMFATEAMRLIFPALPRAVRNRADQGAGEDLLLGAHFAGIAIANSEVGLSHALSYPLGVRYAVPHGLGNAIMIGCTSAFNAEACPEIYNDIGALTGQPDVDASTIGPFLESYVHDLGIDETLTSYGVRLEDLDDLAAAAIGLRGPLDNHRRPVDTRALRDMYAATL
jgi:alcohol dehydrogenase